MLTKAINRCSIGSANKNGLALDGNPTRGLTAINCYGVDMAKSHNTCTVTGCTKKLGPAGMCWMHYARKRRHGTTDGRVDETAHEAIDRHGWDVTDTGCWEWRGPLNTRGYGQITRSRDGVICGQVHRIMYERHIGPIPDGYQIRHKCDNPPCSNPDHLEVGTHSENMRDMWERGRNAGGPNQPFIYAGGRSLARGPLGGR